jgi:hypothetical protein
LNNNLEYCAKCCEDKHEESTVIKASNSTATVGIDPATLQLIISGAFSLVNTLLNAWFNKKLS